LFKTANRTKRTRFNIVVVGFIQEENYLCEFMILTRFVIQTLTDRSVNTWKTKFVFTHVCIMWISGVDTKYR